MYPLYLGGLWLAVMTTPALQWRCSTVKDSWGTECRVLYRYTWMPWPASTQAVSLANTSEKFRES